MPAKKISKRALALAGLYSRLDTETGQVDLNAAIVLAVDFEPAPGGGLRVVFRYVP